MLYIQDPLFTESYTLHEALISSCTPSISGKGAFAFASKSGIEILLRDTEFESLLDRGPFSLIVGIDEITNTSSLESLNSIVSDKPNLSVNAFDSELHDSLFHPKLSFFRKKDETGTLIIGSGNLTLGGLRKNREAFSILPLTIEELIRIEAYWTNWLSQSAQFIKGIDDPDIIAKAKENIYVRGKRKQNKLKQEIEETAGHIFEDGWQFYKENTVLIAEVPKSGDRWKQVNFDIDTFRNFFGANPHDNSQRVLLRNVKMDSTLDKIENRPSVSVVSQNYRFELNAVSGLPYPLNGRPIGVFIRLTTRMFLYHIFMPENEDHGEFNEWLLSNWEGKFDRMKRITTTVNIIQNILVKTVFNQYFPNL